MRTLRSLSVLALAALPACGASQASYTVSYRAAASSPGYAGGSAAVAEAPSGAFRVRAAGGVVSAPARFNGAPVAQAAMAPPAPPSGGGAAFGRSAGSAGAAMGPAAVAPAMRAPASADTAAASGGEALAAPPPPAPTGGVSVTVTVAGGGAGMPVAPGLPVAPEPSQYELPAGLLTAASVGDVDRRDNYLGYLERHYAEQQELGLDLSRRLSVRVVDGAGHPVRDTAVQLELGGVRIEGRTHGDGRWDVFPSLWGVQLSGTGTVRVGQANARVSLPASGDAQDMVLQLQGASDNSAAGRVLDLGFLIDVTGSMGDELRYVNREVQNIVRRVQSEVPGVNVRVGAVFYRDRSDDVQVSQLQFTSQVEGFAQQMQNVYASGGGDYPEDMNLGLEVAMHRLQWSQGPATRVLVVIADAPPQQYPDERFTYREALTEASARGIRLLPVAASGANRTVEYLFRAMGAVTSTPYVYLTDDSGVGGPHMEADTDRVAVERFNDLLVRVVSSDLRGQGMHEPGPLGPRG